MRLKYRLLCVITALVTVLSLASCGTSESEFYKSEYSTSAGELTVWTAYSHGDGNKEEKFTDEELSALGDKAAQCFENLYCRLTSGEELAQINQETDAALDLDADFLSILNKAFLLSIDTNGAYTPAHGAYTQLVRSEGATEEAVAEALTHCGTDKLAISDTSVRKTDKKASVDLCGFASGYALDEALKILKESGVSHARLAVDGIEAVFGSKPDGTVYTVGIKDDSRITGYFRITDGSVAQADSGDKSMNYCASGTGEFRTVTVFSPEACAAQALSKVLINMTEQEARELYKNAKTGFEAVMVKEDGTVVKTDRVDTGLYVPETSETAKDE